MGGEESAGFAGGDGRWLLCEKGGDDGSLSCSCGDYMALAFGFEGLFGSACRYRDR